MLDLDGFQADYVVQHPPYFDDYEDDNIWDSLSNKN